MAWQSLRREVGVHPINSIQHVIRDARENSVCVVAGRVACDIGTGGSAHHLTARTATVASRRTAQRDTSVAAWVASFSAAAATCARHRRLGPTPEQCRCT